MLRFAPSQGYVFLLSNEAGHAMSVNLCQPDPYKACGACCGLYNIIGFSRRTCRRLLRNRTKAFLRDASIDDPNTLNRHYAHFRQREHGLVNLPILRNCPFLGTLPFHNNAPGCLLHPAINDGHDARNAGSYDQKTCGRYLCPAYALLDPLEQRLVIQACGRDAFLYGLVLNDLVLIRTLTEGVQEQLARPLDATDLDQPPFIRAVQRYFRLKTNWPFADPEAPIIGVFIPRAEDYFPSLDKLLITIDYQCLDAPTSRYDLLLRALGSVFEDAEELAQAVAIIYGAISTAANALQQRPRP